MVLLIKKADESLIESMTKTVTESWKSAYTGLIAESDLKSFTDYDYRKSYFEKLFESGEYAYVILCDGKVEGVCTVVDGIDKDVFGSCTVNQLYISPEYQRIGFGRKLLSHTLREMRREGFKRATLYVLDGNDNAVRFYKKFGFEADGKKTKLSGFENDLFASRYRIEL